MNQIIQIFLLAMTPIGELRAAIPVGLAIYKLNWLAVYLIAVVGNLVPVIALLLFLEPIANWLSKHFKICDKFFNWLFARTRHKAENKIKNKGLLALTLFVAIPLPITGAWTGSIIAFLCKIPRRKAFLAITVGVAIAGVIVSLATIGGIAIEYYLGWQILFIILSTIVIVLLICRIRNSKKRRRV